MDTHTHTHTHTHESDCITNRHVQLSRGLNKLASVKKIEKFNFWNAWRIFSLC